MTTQHQPLLKILLLSSLLLSASITSAVNTRGIAITTKEGEELTLYKSSHALIIGVSDYTAGWPDLNSIQSELDSVETALEKKGFNITRVKDPNANELRDAFRGFIADYGYDPENRLLFYFAGHGFTRDNGNKGYLVPADAPNPEKDERGFLRRAYPMTDLIALARNVESTHALFMFDSCFSGTIFKTRALPKLPPAISRLTGRPVRQFITAGDAGEEVPAKSVFTPAFVDAIEFGVGDLNKDGYMTGTELGLYLQDMVPKSVRQTPQFGKINDYELSRGDYVFAMATPGMGATTGTDGTIATPQPGVSEPGIDLGGITTGVGQPPTITIEQWRRDLAAMQNDYSAVIKFETNPENTPAANKEAWRRFLERWKDDIPNTEEDLGLRQTANSRLGPASFRDKLADGSTSPEMIRISPGAFEMGSVSGEGRPDEFPVHNVTIAKPYALSRFEVTFDEYTRFARATGRRPPSDKGYGKGQRPVINISWNNAQSYATWLSEQTGENYRLPTEAEWEYAARAGSESFFNFGNTASPTYANYDSSQAYKGSTTGLPLSKTQEVGKYPANAFDLHDMHGNVAEWVQDCYNDSYSGSPSDQRAWESGDCNQRVVRGGSWTLNPEAMRSASRSKFKSSGRFSFVGFRVARDL